MFFDLNGTLIDDWPASHAGICANFKKYEVPEPTLEEYIRDVAHNGNYKEFYENRGIMADRNALHDIFYPAYERYIGGFHNTQVFPGVYETLVALCENGVEMHIITAATEELAGALLTKTDILKYCRSIHYHVHNKEAHVCAIIDDADIRKERCAMMGDLPSDVIAAKRAGIRGVGFRNPHVPRDLWNDVQNMDYLAFEFSGILDFVAP